MRHGAAGRRREMTEKGRAKGWDEPGERESQGRGQASGNGRARGGANQGMVKPGEGRVRGGANQGSGEPGEGDPREGRVRGERVASVRHTVHRPRADLIGCYGQAK